MAGPTNKPRSNADQSTHLHSKFVVERLAKQARGSVEKDCQNTSWKSMITKYPRFDGNEIQLGKVLGKGGFATVYEVKGFSVSSTKKTTNHGGSAAEGEDGRAFLAEHCFRDDKNRDARYAIKQLSIETIQNEGTFWLGMRDMAIETTYLSEILHPNIVKLRAVAKADPFSEKFFLVMDRLYDTLERRIYKVWQKGKCKGKQIFKSKANDLYSAKIVYAYDLSSAVSYLHQRRIIYRDLKPENVGFDIRDDIKLFDFGLSRELDDSLRTSGSGNLFNFTADTGSPRYMAPEIALGKPYNATCDTYSFSILLWEMLATKTPYECYTVKLLKQRVYSDMQKRPFIQDKWSPAIKTLLQKGWTGNVNERYTMEQVESILQKEALRATGGGNNNESGVVDLKHSRRRSTFVFDNNIRSSGAARTFTNEQLQMELSSSCSDLSSAAGDDDVNEQQQEELILKEESNSSTPAGDSDDISC